MIRPTTSSAVLASWTPRALHERGTGGQVRPDVVDARRQRLHDLELRHELHELERVVGLHVRRHVEVRAAALDRELPLTVVDGHVDVRRQATEQSVGVGPGQNELRSSHAGTISDAGRRARRVLVRAVGATR